MSNSLYNSAREYFATAQLNWTGVTPTLVLVNVSTYTFSATHVHKSDISGIVGSPVAMTSLTASGGACDADDVTFSSVSGSAVGALIIYDDTGVSSTSRLIAYIDTATGLPITPNGGDIIVVWDNGTNRIFRV